MRSLVKHVKLLAVAALAAGWTASAHALDLKCDIAFTNFVQVITVAGGQTTSSTTPVNIPGAVFSYTPSSRCLAVEVTGQVRAKSPGALRLRLRVTPGGEINSGPFPPSRDVYTADTSFDGRSATFFVDLFEGQKVVRVQFMSADGSPVSLSKAVILIYHAPTGS
jgi:hypothetical protein